MLNDFERDSRCAHCRAGALHATRAHEGAIAEFERESADLGASLTAELRAPKKRLEPVLPPDSLEEFDALMKLLMFGDPRSRP